MASFTYTVWAPCTIKEMIDKFKKIFEQKGFLLKNPLTGMCHIWDQEGKCIKIEEDSLRYTKFENLPLGIQWWRNEEDLFVTLGIEKIADGLVSSISLVGLTRSEEAEIGRLLIEHIIPSKMDFPDDFAVFKIDAQ